MDDYQRDDEYHYDRLITDLTAQTGKLNLLLAVCDDRRLQAETIDRYSRELAAEGLRHYRVSVRREEPSLRYAVQQLLEQVPDFEPLEAVVTVEGLDQLSATLRYTDDQLVRLIETSALEPSEQELLFGYLQWRRESLRAFRFPIVIWMPWTIFALLPKRSPDFWGWRGGVFWFGDPLKVNQSLTVSPATDSLSAQPRKERVNTLRRKRLESGIQMLIKEYKAVCQMYSSVIDSVSQIRLARQLEQLEAELEALEAEIEALENSQYGKSE